MHPEMIEFRRKKRSFLKVHLHPNGHRRESNRQPGAIETNAITTKRSAQRGAGIACIRLSALRKGQAGHLPLHKCAIPIVALPSAVCRDSLMVSVGSLQADGPGFDSYWCPLVMHGWGGGGAGLGGG